MTFFIPYLGTGRFRIIEIEQSSGSAKLIGSIKTARGQPVFDFGISGLSEALICNNKG